MHLIFSNADAFGELLGMLDTGSSLFEIVSKSSVKTSRMASINILAVITVWPACYMIFVPYGHQLLPPTYVNQNVRSFCQTAALLIQTTDDVLTNHRCTLLCSKHLSNKCTRKNGWKQSQINVRPLICWIWGSPSNQWLVKWASADPLVLRRAW